MSHCKPKLTFEEKELVILRDAIDKAQARSGRKVIKNPDVKEIISVVEDFLKRKKLVCYGGTAINNILPLEDQFYDKSLELPDYDFFSPRAMEDAIELAKIYVKKGFAQVEAKSGVHYGTFKVFVNFIPVADITQVDKELYETISKHAFRVGGIYYSPPNYLRTVSYTHLTLPTTPYV